jgi:hypothetical protein
MKTDTSILLDIYERLGAIETKLEHATKHDDKSVERHDKLEERVDSLEKFEAKVGAYIWIGGSVVSGALFLLWEGLTYLIPWIKTLLSRSAE